MSEVQTTLPTEQPEAVEVVQQEANPVDRRESLNAAFDKIEARTRDDQGRFAKVDKPVEAKQPQEPAATPAPKLTTWKKDYVPLHEKLEQGLPLTLEEAKKLAEYNYQRENEYKTGISLHKDRAARLESFEKALTPFMPLLQQHNIAPDQWIGNLGRAHQLLATGTPEQKLQAFAKLAGDYQVPLAQLLGQQGQQTPHAGVYDELNAFRSQLQQIAQWREQVEQKEVNSILQKFNDAEKYPHFEKVRLPMSQLLEAGLARDPDEAYDAAVHMNPELRAMEQQRLSQAAQASEAAARAAKEARAKAVSPRSSTPSGQVSNKPPATDRRALLESAFEGVTGRV